MQKLQRLINSLSGDELLAIRRIPLVGKQRQVMVYCLSQYRTTSLSTELPKGLQTTSPGHLYQISSVLLKRCYDALVPEGGLLLLELLSQKNLITLYKEVFRRYEVDAIALKNTPKLLDFYLCCIAQLYRFDFTLVDDELITKLQSKYARLAKTEPTRLLWLEGIVLYESLRFRLFDYENFHENLAKLGELTTEYLSRVQFNGDSFSKYLGHCARAHYLFFAQFDAKGALEQYQQAELFARELPLFCYRNESSLFKFRYADMLYGTGENKNAFLQFKNYFQEETSQGGNKYYLLRYAELAIFNNDFVLANDLLNNKLNAVFYTSPCYGAVQVSLLQAIIKLLSGDPAATLDCLEIAFDNNSKKNYHLFSDIRCRIVECVAYVLQKDFKYAKVLINRSKQLLRSHNLGLQNYSVGYVFSLCASFIDCYEQGKELSGDALNNYRKFTTNIYGPYAKILQYLREQFEVTLSSE